MRRKKMTALIALILVVLMLITLVASIIPTAAFAVNQSEIDEIQQQKNQLSNRVQDAKDRLEKLKADKSNVLEQKLALEEQGRIAQEQLDLVAQEIAIYDGMIAEKAKEVEQAKNREAEQLRRYRARIRAMEESGGYNILALFAGAENFSELLTAIDDIGEIMESDKRLEHKYAAAREETEDIKAEYEQVRAEYGEKQDALREEQAQIEKEMQEAQEMLDSLEAEIERAIAEYKAAEAAEAAAEATVLAMIQRYNEQQRQEAANNQPSGGAYTPTGSDNSGGGDNGSGGGGSGGGTTAPGGLNPGAATGTGTFIWPVPCSTRVTSRYGNRIDPFTYEERYHSGIDIDGYGNAGNNIVAADGGTVITASFDGGYGNYVIIDHGNSVQTLYAHMSGIAVTKGSWVEQGQVIGYLGDSGRATGVHCHFEVFVNGGRTDPAAYFSGLTYWNC